MSDGRSSSCYWYSQGQCFLNLVPEYEVFEIIKQSPIARDAVATCVAKGCCEAPSQRVLDFAESAELVQSEKQANEEFQKRQNTYRDNSAYIGPGVFRTPPNSDGEE